MKLAGSILCLLACACTSTPSRRGEPPAALESYFPGDPGLPWQMVGSSVEGRPIYAAEFGYGSRTTLILAAIHGDEPLSAKVAVRLALELSRMRSVLQDNRVVVVPIVNPDGYVPGRRANAVGVDLNRNFPTRDWGGASLREKDFPGLSPASEPETRTVLALIERCRPDKILSIHTPLRVNNYDGPQSESLALSMETHNRYPVSGYIGYPTPGSLGTWAGIERDVATVTLEIPEGTFETRWNENKWALIAAVRHRPARGASGKPANALR